MLNPLADGFFIFLLTIKMVGIIVFQLYHDQHSGT